MQLTIKLFWLTLCGIALGETGTKLTSVGRCINPLYTTEECGTFGLEDYTIYFMKENEYISPFHDIPLFANEANRIYNMVVEIPRGTDEKMEITKDKILNPIKQDVKNGKPRKVGSKYTHNYGAFPQTWEHNHEKDPITRIAGDNDPIDVVEIGEKALKRGQVVQVKLLGIFALMDENETDWKVIAIDVEDKNASKLNDLDDIDKETIDDIKKWFKNYKSPTINIIYEDKVFGRETAYCVISHTNEYWKQLMKPEYTNTMIIRYRLPI